MWSIYTFNDGMQMLAYEDGENYRAWWLIRNDQHLAGPRPVEVQRSWVDAAHFKAWLRMRMHDVGGTTVSA